MVGVEAREDRDTNAGGWPWSLSAEMLRQEGKARLCMQLHIEIRSRVDRTKEEHIPRNASGTLKPKENLKHDFTGEK